ncbi:MAG TPA: amino acid ABC transporter permease [Alphaproteobacteria bacterium]|nr:amino acid ABC transporter permease [Alphaproteobacteria bacterium]
MDLAPQLVNFVARYVPYLAQGFALTLALAAASVPLSLAWSLAILLPRLSKRHWLAAVAAAYIEVMRNTPLLIQMYLIYFGLPLFNIFLSGFACGVLAITLQHGAFLAEVLRGGVESVSARQWEAARAIGMRNRQAFRLVVLPQAVVKVVPPICNQLIVLVKDTSLVSAIGVMEVTLSAKVIIERTGASYEVFVAVALFYLVMTTALGAGLRVAERRLALRFG